MKRWAWPACLCATGLLGYAAQKAWYAGQGRLGIPGGAAVPASAYEELGNVALRQWTLAGLGLVGALLALATVVPAGRRVPRWVLLAGLWGALVPMVAGAPYLAASGSAVGLARGSVVLLLWGAMTWSYQVRSR